MAAKTALKKCLRKLWSEDLIPEGRVSVARLPWAFWGRAVLLHAVGTQSL